jgi:hypothetical protein
VIAASCWVDELQRVFDREIQRVLGQQECSTVNRAARLRCHTRRNPDSYIRRASDAVRVRTVDCGVDT